ncbi:hypothetical protein [Adonisia turfae]|uniref:PEP-CTERM sorting domain-containing protein n=1 Tax=Adonisia turfae CCMR0081 TaxID=2292702 RepID=A0A6M0RNP2_9CYAN|nr:hypothetical protein [Adonisia turfae]NEZ57786.1 hypothetical protein [Adonisia turfae CCMR0081]
MKPLKPFLLLIGCTLSSLAVVHVACAGTFHQGWTYSIDAANDGVGGDGYGRLIDHSNSAQDIPESSPMISVLVIGLLATLVHRDYR